MRKAQEVDALTQLKRMIKGKRTVFFKSRERVNRLIDELTERRQKMNLDEKTESAAQKSKYLFDSYKDVREAIHKMEVKCHYKCATENGEWLPDVVKAHALAALDTIWHNELVKIAEDNSDDEKSE